VSAAAVPGAMFDSPTSKRSTAKRMGALGSVARGVELGAAVAGAPDPLALGSADGVGEGVGSSLGVALGSGSPTGRAV
jgi:hypothetical protein